MGILKEAIDLKVSQAGESQRGEILARIAEVQQALDGLAGAVKALAARPDPEFDIDLAEVVEAVKAEVAALPKPDRVDLGPVMRALAELPAAIPKPVETSLAPVLTRMQALSDQMTAEKPTRQWRFQVERENGRISAITGEATG